MTAALEGITRHWRHPPERPHAQAAPLAAWRCVATAVETSLLINVDQQNAVFVYVFTRFYEENDKYLPTAHHRPAHSSRETHSPFYSFFRVQVIRTNTCYTIIINQDFIFPP